MREPLLSIIIVSYENSSLILRRAIQSVLEQSYQNYEIILIDANESGSAYSLGLREDMEKYPDIPVIVCPSKKGEFAAAKNEGAAQANGTYLAFLMAKDAWNQECAATQVEVLEENPDVALVFCHSWMQEEDALSIQYKMAPEVGGNSGNTAGLLSQDSIHSVSQVMFRRTAFEDMLGFDTHIHRQDDYDMWIRLAEKHRIASIDQNLVCSYVEKSTLKKSHKLIDVVGYLQLYSKHRDMYRKNREARYELFQRIAACYKDEKYYFTWFKYAVRIKVLEMRLGKKKEKPKALPQEAREAVPSYDLMPQQDKEFIAVVKHTDGGEGNVALPEAGAEFQLYLKSAGSYESAKANERDTLVCDEGGYARSKALSQGTYIVHQTQGRSGVEMAEDFEVTLDRTGKTHTVSVRSSEQRFFVKVVQKDAETGNVIPLAGGTYMISDSAGKMVTMMVTYPEPMLLETFSAGANGYFITPDKLKNGMYQMTVKEAPYGYVKRAQPVSFEISETGAAVENGIAIVTVSAENVAQKGRITLHKSGPVLSKVDISDNTIRGTGGYSVGGESVYTPRFEESSVAGAVYEIIADEDIVTPDGTLRMSKDTVAETVVTDEGGNAVSGELYLGKYRVEEKKAPYGLLRNTEIKKAELLYADGGATGTETFLEFEGERQNVFIHLEKTLGEDRIFGIGDKGEIKDFAFGLFAAENIMLSDGTEIPKDGLIDIRHCDEAGKICFALDIPYGSYYVRELLTNSHYRCSDTRYEVRFAYQDQNTKEIHLYVNDGNQIPSEMIRGTIRGVKTDQHNHPLAMAEIGLFTVETTEFSKDSSVLVSITDWNGMFYFKDIPCGDYIVREINAPQGYMLNEAMYYISLTFDEQRIDLKLINHRME